MLAGSVLAAAQVYFPESVGLAFDTVSRDLTLGVEKICTVMPPLSVS